MDIFNGKFGGMTVQGQRWRTPLQLTAERIEVGGWVGGGDTVRARVGACTCASIRLLCCVF